LGRGRPHSLASQPASGSSTVESVLLEQSQDGLRELIGLGEHRRARLDARWPQLQGNAKLPSIGKDVDDAMVALECDNPRLKGALNKNYGRTDLDTAQRESAFPPREATPQSLSAAKDKHRLGELIDLIGSIQLADVASRSKNLLGRVFEPSGARQTANSSPKGERGGANQYFLTQFASAGGKNGGQFGDISIYALAA